ncbi:MAG: hypothetical protein IKK84_00260 [Clostridia bacterium]|nr:hypothetical protein [Clostridia bacterium]
MSLTFHNLRRREAAKAKVTEKVAEVAENVAEVAEEVAEVAEAKGKKKRK